MYLRLMEILVFSRNIDIPTVLLKALCRHPLKRNYASLFFLLWRFCWICYHSLYSMPTASIYNFLKFKLILLFLAHTGGFVMLTFVLLWASCCIDISRREKKKKWLRVISVLEDQIQKKRMSRIKADTIEIWLHLCNFRKWNRKSKW